MYTYKNCENVVTHMCQFFMVQNLYIKRVNEKNYSRIAIVVLVCSIFTISLAVASSSSFFFFFVNAYSYSRFSTLFFVCPISTISHYNKILTQQTDTIFSQLLRC